MLKKWYLVVLLIGLVLWMAYIVIGQPVDMAGHLIGWGIVFLLGVGQYYFITRKKTEPPAREMIIAEGERVKDFIGDLDSSIARLNNNLDNATQRIEDIKIRSVHLVNLVQALAIRADQMAEESKRHGELLDAIAKAQEDNNLVPVFKLAAKIGDPLISNMIFTSTTSPGYWMGATKTIAVNFGTLARWAEAYNDYAHDLLLQIAKNQKAVAELKARQELAELVEPLAYISNNLNQAHTYLQIERPALQGVAPAMRSMSPIYSRPALPK